MKIEDVRKIAEEKDLPKHIIERFLSEIEVDAEANVVDELGVIYNLNELAFNIYCIRRNLEAVKRMKEQRRNRKTNDED